MYSTQLKTAIVNFLKHQDRFVRRAAARELGKLVKHEINREKFLELAVEPLIQVMRNNSISNVRDTAFEALISISDKTALSENQSKELIKVKRALWREKYRKNFPDWINNKLIDDRKKQQSNLPHIDDLPGLIQNLQDYQAEVREGIVELIAKKSKTDKTIVNDTIKPLINLLKNPNEDPDVRVAVVEAIGEIGSCSQDIVDALIDALNIDKESDRYVRQAAAEVIGKLIATDNSCFKDNLLKKTVDALNKAIREDVISNVRDTVQQTLNDIFHKTGSELAQRYLQKINRESLEPLEIKDLDKIINVLKESNDVDERIKAIQALSRVKTIISFDTLKQALNEQEPDICAAAADALGQIVHPSAIECLLAKVKDKDKDKDKPEYYKDRIAREAVVRAIGNLNLTLEELNKQQVVEILIDIWRNDAISNVRDAVEFAMQAIYQRSQHPNTYKALKRYPDYDNPEKQSKYNGLNTKEFYDKFFDEI